jgi:hypothetical protein
MRAMELFDNKSYEICNLSEDTSIFEGYYKDYIVDTELLVRLSKNLGFSYDLYNALSKVDNYSADIMIKSMIQKNNIKGIVLLLDKEEKKIIDYSIDSDRLPIMNKDFVSKVLSLSETCSEISLSEIYYSREDTISSIILKKNSPIVIEEKYEGKESKFTEYPIGILLVNDEINSVYSRLVLYVEGQPLYLPASYYNATNTRFRRSTSSSMEALEVLILKIFDDLREDSLNYKMQDFHYRYRSNMHILASYEEYNSVLRTMRKIPTIIEDNSFLDFLSSKYENFEKKYSHLEDKKSSYVWRCTAISDITVGALVSITSSILSDLNAPPIEYFAIRDLLGSYISTNRIAEEIAKEDM